MNKPAKIKSVSPDYDADGYGWAMAQAALIRDRRFDQVDWANVIEEIESVGKSEQASVESALRVVLMHLLKWEHQKAFRSRSWAASVREHLNRFDRLMAKNPGLKSKLPEILVDAYSMARLEASNETGLDIDLFPATPPDWDAIRTPLDL